MPSPASPPPLLKDAEQYARAKWLVARWAGQIKEMDYEERRRRREANLPPFDRYWRGVEAIVIYEWEPEG